MSYYLFIFFLFFASAHAESTGIPAPLFTESTGEEFHFDPNFPDTAPTEGERAPDDFQGKFVRMLFILVLLIAFMILASWALKRMMHTRVAQINDTSRIKLIETRTLSTRSTLYLLEIDDASFLVGESAAGLFRLDTTFDTTPKPPKEYKKNNEIFSS